MTEKSLENFTLANDWDVSKRPNSFIVGAPKCGTTALCNYLQNHPEVYMSRSKEPHYFAGDEMPLKARKFTQVEQYANLFDNVQEHHKVRAEGSVWYLYSQTAIQNISQFDPNAKIIVMLRRPDEMVYSMHTQALNSFTEDIQSFETAWETALQGNNRKSWPPLCDYRPKLDYHRIALYSEQLDRLYKYFPENQVHVIFYDDFKNQPETCFRQVLDFLEIGEFSIDFNKINESQVIVNRTLGRYLTKPPAFIMSTSRLIKKVMRVEKLGWRDRLRNANSRVQKRAPLDPRLKTEIINNYREDIRKLGEMCNRDLSHWLS